MILYGAAAPTLSNSANNVGFVQFADVVDVLKSKQLGSLGS